MNPLQFGVFLQTYPGEEAQLKELAHQISVVKGPMKFSYLHLEDSQFDKIIHDMKLLKQIPEAAMVAAFLKAEIFSPRFGEDVRKAMQSFGVDDAIITHPDITNDQENELRARVLGECRGYRQNREMFEGVPTNLSWYEAKLSHNEIGDLRYVDYSYWNALTDGTHLVKDGVRNIQKGKVVFDVPNDRFLMLTEAIRNGKHDFEPTILWGQNIDSSLEILEGHLRTTAFALAGDTAPAVIKVLVGLIEVPLISLTE